MDMRPGGSVVARAVMCVRAPDLPSWRPDSADASRCCGRGRRVDRQVVSFTFELHLQRFSLAGTGLIYRSVPILRPETNE